MAKPKKGTRRVGQPVDESEYTSPPMTPDEFWDTVSYIGKGWPGPNEPTAEWWALAEAEEKAEEEKERKKAARAAAKKKSPSRKRKKV